MTDIGRVAEDLARSWRWSRALPSRVSYRRPGVRPTDFANVDTSLLVVMAGSGVTMNERTQAARDELMRRSWSKRTIVARGTLPAISRALEGLPAQWHQVVAIVWAAHCDGAAAVQAPWEFWASECPSNRPGRTGVARSTWGLYRRGLEEAGWLTVISWTVAGERGSTGRKEVLLYAPGPRLLEQLADPAAAGQARRAHEVVVYQRQRGTPPRTTPTQQDLPDPTPASGEEVVVWADEPRVEEVTRTPVEDDARRERYLRAGVGAVPCPTRAEGVPWVCTKAEHTHDLLVAEMEAVTEIHAPIPITEALLEVDLADLGGAPEPLTSVHPSEHRTATARVKISERQNGLIAEKPPARPPLGQCADRADSCPKGQDRRRRDLTDGTGGDAPEFAARREVLRRQVDVLAAARAEGRDLTPAEIASVSPAARPPPTCPTGQVAPMRVDHLPADVQDLWREGLRRLGCLTDVGDDT